MHNSCFIIRIDIQAKVGFFVFVFNSNNNNNIININDNNNFVTFLKT